MGEEPINLSYEFPVSGEGMAGRPTKYRKEYCERVPELMAEGMSKVEVCAELGVDYHTFLSWQEKHPRFLQSIKKGNRLSEAWWMREGRLALRDKDFNYTGWYMNMRNRHGWADKTENKNEIDLKNAPTVKVIVEAENVRTRDQTPS